MYMFDYISSNHHRCNANVPDTTHKATYDAVKIWKTIFDAFTQSPTFCSKSRKRALHQVNEKFFLIGGLCINLIGP